MTDDQLKFGWLNFLIFDLFFLSFIIMYVLIPKALASEIGPALKYHMLSPLSHVCQSTPVP